MGIQNIIQSILGSGAFAGENDGFTLEILHFFDGGSAVVGQIEDPDGVDHNHLQKFRLAVVQHGGEIAGYAGDIDFALNQ